MAKRSRLRRSLLLATLAAAVGCFALFAWMHNPEYGIKRESAEKIQIGMTEEDVQQLIGVPTQPLGRFPILDAAWSPVIEIGSAKNRDWKFTRSWFTPDVLIHVTFDQDDKVMDLTAFVPPEESFPKNLLRRLRHLWD